MSIIFHQHPEYQSKLSDWVLYRDLYEAKHDVLQGTSYLWPHQIELKGDAGAIQLRASREQRTRYLGLPEMILSLWESFLFPKEPTADDAVKKLMGDAINDVDGKKTTLYGYVKNTACQYLNYGKSLTLVSKNTFEAKNQAQYLALGIRPVFEMISPLSLMDWSIDCHSSARIGRYNMTRLEYDLYAERARAQEAPTNERISDEYYVESGAVWIARYRIAKDDKGSPKTDSGHVLWELMPEFPRKLELAEIPLASMHGESWIKEADEEVLRHFNLRSNKDNILYNQGFQRIIIFGIDKLDAQFGEYIISTVREPGAHMEQVEPVSVDGYNLAIAEALDNVFKVGLNRWRSLPADSKAGQAADSQAEESKHAIELARTLLTDVENYINDAISHWAAFEGKKDFKGKVTLFKDIKAEDWDRFVQAYNSFRDDLREIPTLRKEALKKLPDLFNITDADDKEAIEKEIDGLKDPVIEENQLNSPDLFRKAVGSTASA